MNEGDFTRYRRHINSLSNAFTGQDTKGVFQVRRKSLNLGPLFRNDIVQDTFHEGSHLDLLTVGECPFRSCRNGSKESLSLVEIGIHKYGKLIVSHTQVGRSYPCGVATVQAAVEFDEYRSPVGNVHDFGVNGTVLESHGAQYSFGVIEYFVEFGSLGIAGHDEFFTEANEGCAIAGSLVVLEHGRCFDFSIENDGIDNVFVAVQIFLQQDTGLCVVFVFVSAMTLVFAGHDFVVGFPDGRVGIAQSDSDGSGSGLGFDDHAWLVMVGLQKGLDFFRRAYQLFPDRVQSGRPQQVGLRVFVDFGLTRG